MVKNTISTEAWFVVVSSAWVVGEGVHAPLWILAVQCGRQNDVLPQRYPHPNCGTCEHGHTLWYRGILQM